MQQPLKINKPKRKFSKYPLKARFGSNNNLIFILCLLIATLAWTLTKLSATYTVSYTFDVKYEDLPVDMKLTKVADSSVVISLTDKGFALMKLEFFSNLRNLRINVSDYKLLNEKNNFYQISTKEVRKYLSDETRIEPDNIVFSKPYLGFEMEELQKKKVIVIEKHAIQLREQYDLYGPIQISPNKITVYGPKNILDTLQSVVTENILINKTDSVQSIQSRLINQLPSLLRFEPETVTVNFRVEKFTESSLEVHVNINSIQDDITIFPKTVKVSFKIAQKDFNNIDPGLFVIKPVTEGININKVNKLKLQITKKPSYIRDEWLAPSEVEFLIIK